MSAQTNFRALRPEYLALTDGNACAAILLDLFAYWTQVRKSNDDQAQSGGEEGNDLWFYRSLTDLYDDLFGAFGRAAIRTALKLLTDKGLIESRRNPAKPWDRTVQYRTLHGAKSNDVQGAESNDDAGARPSQPLAAQDEVVKRDEKRDEIRLVFDGWVSSTRRSPTRTKLSDQRRACIRRALADYGLDDCLAAVRNIGRDAWASGQNDRGRPFNDIEHALGTAKRLEDWRDWQPPAPQLVASSNGHRTPNGDLLRAVNAAEQSNANTIEGTAHDLG